MDISRMADRIAGPRDVDNKDVDWDINFNIIAKRDDFQMDVFVVLFAHN